jgi:CheY-like chemotaxis protein
MKRNARCAVVSDSQAEVTLVHFLLEREFSEILDVLSEEGFQSLLQREDVAVVLLAFTDWEVASGFLQRYTQGASHGIHKPAQVVLLCSREDVGAAYELCRANEIFDYVMFWPVTHDPKRLPLAVHRACDAYERMSCEPASGLVPEASHRAMRDLSVLVVEDDPFQLAVAMSVLIASGLRAVGAAGAQAAQTLLETSRPALILLDVDMPDVGGMELLRLLKADKRHAGIPVIMLTVSGERQLVLEALGAGAADFIVKPFDRDTLLQKIDRVAVDRA